MSLMTKPGRLSALGLAASGIAIAASPKRVGDVLHIPASSARGLAETRVGLGGTFAGLGLWALARGTSDAYTAIGMTWLGAAVVRVVSLRLDEPETDWTFWAYLTGEVSLGLAGLAARGR